jgi:putative transposase
MKVIKAHKIRLNPTLEQEQYFWRAAGVARYAYNWGLEYYNLFLDYNRQVEKAGIGDVIPVSGRLLRKRFCQVKPDFISEVTYWAYDGAFNDLQAAFSRYWDKYKRGDNKPPKGWKPRKDGRPYGWPKYKRRYKSIPSFYLHNQVLHLSGYNFWFDQKRVGWINMTESLRFNGKIMGGRISYRTNHWWLSVQVEVEHDLLKHNGDAVGIDLGIKYLAVTSDGQVYDNPKPLERTQRKLRRLQRKLNRQRRANNPDNYNEDGTCKRGVRWVKSQNMIKTEKQITKLHYRIGCLRNEASHQMTTDLARNYGIIGIEDLNIGGMLKNGKLSKAIGDAALYEKRRQLTYKTEWNGGIVIPVDRWFPSSKRCSECGWINAELKLSNRQWICEECGTTHHRDGNAAVNIRDEALRILYSSDYSDGEDKRLGVNSDNGRIAK